MTRRMPLYAVLIAALCAFAGLLHKDDPLQSAVHAFGRLPVLDEGRIKPLDSVARSTLLVIQGRQRVITASGDELDPDAWLLDVFFRPASADTYRTFLVDNPDLLQLLGRNEENLAIHYEGSLKQAMAAVGFLPSRMRRLSFAEIAPYFDKLEEQVKLAEPIEPQSRTQFQSSVIQLNQALGRYVRLRRALVPEGEKDFLGSLLALQGSLHDSIEAVRAKQQGRAYDQAKADALMGMGQKFLAMDDPGALRVVPPSGASPSDADWSNAGHALLSGLGGEDVDPVVLAYAGMGYAWAGAEYPQFAHIVELYGSSVGKRLVDTARRVRVETIFNQVEPFYGSMLIYFFAFCLAAVSWLRWEAPARRSAFALVALAWLISTAGLAARMWLEGRPPVTNLYSSALFIGWAAVGLCLYLEGSHRNAIGSACAGVIGFATLLIAHNLALAGDTMEMMRAVLDSNFWLGTHVVVVTLGYASTFLAGILAVFYILRGVFTRSLDAGTADSIARMVYGIVCFATLFSFVGTVLGGVWADQSWGRFWGWDPKENGALIIVLWNALILHARWAGWVRQRGLVALAVFGNIVTAWSWFGTNMLGVGLHSYGFTDAAFRWLSVFVALQLALIGAACIPPSRWRSRVE